MVKCKEILDILSDYVDGELTEGQCGQIQEHLKDCSRCREFVETFRESLELAHNLDKELPPKNVCESVLQALKKVRDQSNS